MLECVRFHDDAKNRAALDLIADLDLWREFPLLRAVNRVEACAAAG